MASGEAYHNGPPPAGAAFPPQQPQHPQPQRFQELQPPGLGPMHSFKLEGAKFIVDTKYTPNKLIGRGAYGVVCSAFDQVRGKKVAIKKIPNWVDDLVDAKRILREVKMLRHFRHENIICLRDLINPPGNAELDDVYMVMDYMETDLHKIIYSNNDLTDEHIQYFIWQLLRALKFLHSGRVIHRDLKPSNLLLNQNCQLKVCDFGLARGVDVEESYELTEYVVTRWYRAPEIMCACQDYDYQIDVWAVGCILAELLGKKPLFPGKDYIKQMELFFAVLGTPSNEDIAFISNPKAREYVLSLAPRQRVPWNRIYPRANPQALELLEGLLQFSPAKRITVDQALNHPYLAALKQEDLDDTCPDPFDFSFENTKMTVASLKTMMWGEIMHFRPALKRVKTHEVKWLAQQQALSQQVVAQRRQQRLLAEHQALQQQQFKQGGSAADPDKMQIDQAMYHHHQVPAGQQPQQQGYMAAQAPQPQYHPQNAQQQQQHAYAQAQQQQQVQAQQQYFAATGPSYQ